MVQLIKFSLVGVLNTALSFCIYTLLIFLGVNYLVSNIIAYCTGTVNSYLWNKGWVFKSKKSHSEIFYKFIGVNLITMFFNSLLLFLFVTTMGLNKLISQIMATFLGILTNFLLNKLWTFKITDPLTPKIESRVNQL